MGLVAPAAFALVFASSIALRELYAPGLAFFVAATLLAGAVAIAARFWIAGKTPLER